MTQLHAVHAENYATRREIADRAARIDKLSVDRSRFDKMPLPRWGVEAESLEPQHQAFRAELSAADRWRARKALFALTAK